MVTMYKKARKVLSFPNIYKEVHGDLKSFFAFNLSKIFIIILQINFSNNLKPIYNSKIVCEYTNCQITNYS